MLANEVGALYAVNERHLILKMFLRIRTLLKTSKMINVKENKTWKF